MSNLKLIQFMLLISLLFVFSCEKGEYSENDSTEIDDPNEIDNSPTYLTKISYNRHPLNYYYDNDGKLLKTDYYHSSHTVYDFIYDNDDNITNVSGTVIAGTNSYNLSFYDDIIVYTIYQVGSVWGKYTFKNIIIEGDIYNGNGSISYTKDIQYENDDETYLFEYKNGNLIKQIQTFPPTYEEVFEYIYDDKNNPYLLIGSNPEEFKYLSSYFPRTYPIWAGSLLTTSKNNVTKIVRKGYRDGILANTYNYSCAYIYNNEEFPTSATFTDDNGDTFPIEYTYKKQGIVGEWYKLPAIVSTYPFAVRLRFYPDHTGTEERVMSCDNGYTLSNISFNWKIEDNILIFSNFSEMQGCGSTSSGPDGYNTTFTLDGNELIMNDGSNITWHFNRDL